MLIQSWSFIISLCSTGCLLCVWLLQGHTVEVRVRGEKDTYEGLFRTLSPGLEIALDGVLVGSPDRERHSPDGRGDSPFDSVAAAVQSAPGHLAGLVRNMERLKNANPSHQPLQETMVFSLKDVISVTAYNIDMDYATKGKIIRLLVSLFVCFCCSGYNNSTLIECWRSRPSPVLDADSRCQCIFFVHRGAVSNFITTCQYGVLRKQM